MTLRKKGGNAFLSKLRFLLKLKLYFRNFNMGNKKLENLNNMIKYLKQKSNFL